MYTVIPAVIPESREHVRRLLSQLSFASWVQIDVVDGEFVPFSSWPYDPLGHIGDIRNELADRNIEVDLMVRHPFDVARQWLDVGAKRLVFHVESIERPEDFISLSESCGCELGISLQNDTDPAVLGQYALHCDYIQLMGIAAIGTQGQPFDERVLTRAKELKDTYPHLVLQVDGSVNEDTIMRLKEAGIQRFVSGSAILEARDKEAAYRSLLARVSAH